MNFNRVLYMNDMIELRLEIPYLYACEIKMVKAIDAKICMHFFEMHSTDIPKRMSDKASGSHLKRRGV